MIDKVIEIGFLFDFYGKLLTNKQQDIIILYYYEDLSLGEIADKVNISRQGVYDHLQRAEISLRDYERKLGLIARYKKLKIELESLGRFIKSRDDIDKKIKRELETRFEEISKLL